MTDKTIKNMAKELAGVFYNESDRSPEFRKTFPTFKSYIRGQWHMPDGDIIINKPGWMYHVDLARKLLVIMLGDKRVSEPMKERIYDALLSEHKQATAQGAKKVIQRH